MERDELLATIALLKSENGDLYDALWDAQDRLRAKTGVTDGTGWVSPVAPIPCMYFVHTHTRSPRVRRGRVGGGCNDRHPDRHTRQAKGDAG